MCKNTTVSDAIATPGLDRCVGCSKSCVSKTHPAIIIAPHASQSFADPRLRDAYCSLRDTHHAIDIGTAELSQCLAASSGAKLVSGTVGRLGIDLNRAPELAFYADRPKDIAVVSDPAQRAALTVAYDAFHEEIATYVAETLARGATPVLIDLHSFNRTWNGIRRAVDIGICDHGHDKAAKDLLAFATVEFGAAYTVRLDEPYSGTHPGAFIGRHYKSLGAITVTIEICNDLIATPEGRATLVPGLTRAITHLQTKELCHD